VAKAEAVEDTVSEDATKARRWIAAVTAAEKFWAPYRKRCETVLDRYEDERKGADSKKHKYNIFWSNIETLKPACYARVPQATVLRRYADADPLGRVAAEVLERAINFSNDAYDFDQVLKDVRDEFLLLAKGTSWVRYVPTIEEPAQPKGVEDIVRDGGETNPSDNDNEAPPPAPKVTNEEVITDYVNYQDWGCNKCRKWSETRFVYRMCYMDRAALKKRFGNDIGSAIPLDFKPPGEAASENPDIGQAVVFEIWDKPSKTAIWISLAYNERVLDERPDPLKLDDFFPCPKPALGTTSPRTIKPIPDFSQYQDLVNECDKLTGRIDILTGSLKMVGLYAGDEKLTISQLFKEGNENQMIPVDTWAAFAEKGGIKGVIEWVPIEKVAEVLKGLYDARDRVIAAIYQICAISDIMRGDTDAGETAAAQKLKTTWGSSRIREKQKEMARFARDDMNLKGQVIAKNFSIETLKKMTNVQLLTREEKAAIEAYMAAVQQLEAQNKAQQDAMMAEAQPGAAPPQMPVQQPPPPPFPVAKMELIDKPTWEDVDELFKSDDLRMFRIDIETDSTVEVDMQAARRDAAEFAKAFGELIAGSMQAVQMAPPLGKVVAAFARHLCRKYEAGREMEEVIDKAMAEITAMPAPKPEEPAQKGKTPEELALEAQKVQVASRKNDIAEQKVQGDLENSRADAQTNTMYAENERMRMQIDAMTARQDDMTRRLEALIDAQTRALEARSAASVPVAA